LLGGILQRAAEAKRIDHNPQRCARHGCLATLRLVPPPAQVEELRRALGPRDRTIVSVLAYAGLRPGELRASQWRHVGERTLLINANKTGSRRSVRLLAPYAMISSAGEAPAAIPRPRRMCSRLRTATLGARMRSRNGAGESSRRLYARPTSTGGDPTTCATRSPRCSFRGPERDLCGPAARARCGTHDARLRPRHRRARGPAKFPAEDAIQEPRGQAGRAWKAQRPTPRNASTIPATGDETGRRKCTLSVPVALGPGNAPSWVPLRQGAPPRVGSQGFPAGPSKGARYSLIQV
jgi:hypothetical protein